MLPNKWQIKITPENKDILQKYWKNLTPFPVSVNGCNVGLEADFRDCLLSTPHDGTYLWYGIGAYENYEEISLDTFKKYVLKENDFDPEDWNIEVSSKEQFDEVMRYIKPETSNRVWERSDCGFGGGSKFLYKQGIDWSYSKTSSYNYPVKKRITWEQFQTLKNKNMKYTIQDLKTKNLVVFLTEQQYNKLCKALGFDIVSRYYGEYTYCPRDRSYSTFGSKDCIGTYNSHTFIKFEDIDFGEKIIGYKAPMDLYGKYIKKGDIYKVCINRDFYEPVEGSNDSLILPKEIVETWEPVYKEVIKSEIISLGTPARVFTVYKDLIEMKDGDGEIRNYSTADLESLLSKFRSSVWNGVNIDVTSMQLGCTMGTELRKVDLLKIQEIQTKLNG